MSAADPTQRRTDRIEIIGEPRGEVMVYQPMVLAEVSRAGALVETAFPLQIDSLHDFRFALGDRSIVVKGRVVHAHVSNVEDAATVYRSGIEFVEPSAHVIEAIGEFMDGIAAAKARQE